MESNWLTYHDVYRDRPVPGIPRSASSYHVPLEVFKSHLDVIRSSGVPAIGVNEFLANRDRSSVVLTFDDGWVGTFENALPILQDAGMSATFFITRNFVGREGFCTTAMIRNAVNARFSVGVHGTTHRVLTGCSKEQVLEEFKACKDFLEDVTGQPVRAASAPLGESSPFIIECAREVGIDCLCTSRPGSNGKRTPLMQLRRMAVRDSTTLADIRRYCTGKVRREFARWAVVRTSRRILGEGTYAQLVRLLLDHSSDAPEVFDLYLKQPK